MCYSVFSIDSVMLKLCLDRYNTQRMFDEAVDDYLSAWKFVPNWFLTTDKKIRKLHEALFNNDDKLFFDEDFCNVTFFADQKGILKVDFDKINLDGVDFYEDHPRTIIHVRRLV